MSWILFKYENGGNPYIAKTEKEAKRIINKYKNRIEKIDNETYFIKEEKKELNKNAGILYPLF